MFSSDTNLSWPVAIFNGVRNSKSYYSACDLRKMKSLSFTTQAKSSFQVGLDFLLSLYAHKAQHQFHHSGLVGYAVAAGQVFCGGFAFIGALATGHFYAGGDGGGFFGGRDAVDAFGTHGVTFCGQIDARKPSCE